MKKFMQRLRGGAPLWVPEALRGEVRDYVQEPYWGTASDARKAIREELEAPVILDGKMRLRVNSYVDETLVAYFHELDSQYGRKIEGAGVSEVVLSLNTYGGIVTDGFEIVDMVREWNRTREVKLSFAAAGAVYSMGVPIVLSGYRRYSYPNAQFLIHQVSGFAWGTVENVEDSFISMKKLNDRIASLITDRTNWTREEVEVLMRRDSTFDPEEALEHGMVEEILDQEEDPSGDPDDGDGEEEAKARENRERSLRALDLFEMGR